MSRVIRPQSASKIRSDLLQALAHAVASDQASVLDQSERRDILAFSVRILEEIMESVSATSNAWEKRGYWVKADRFMAEWAWASTWLKQLTQAYGQPELAPSEALYGRLSDHLSQVSIPVRMRRTKPWTGAWKRWKSPESASDK